MCADGAFEVLSDERDRALDAMTEYWGSFQVSYSALDDPHEANYAELDGAPTVEKDMFTHKGHVYKTSLLMEGVRKGDSGKGRYLWPGKAAWVRWEGTAGKSNEDIPAEVCSDADCSN
jgi:hypothetical protein